ncbi:MAG: prolipoprotein diacylglyceryl transferase [Lachnospiraceae bacterium]|nr:prolipoprotein diacylglyceryl transferase [Lachnospiraceae bacterium]
MDLCTINFPNLGIKLHNIGEGISIFGFEIKYYGIVITLGFILAYFLTRAEAKRTKQDPEIYLDYLLCMILPAIIGARLYYVIFSWDLYKDNPIQVFNIRGGGLAIYGGIIAGVITLIVFCMVRKQKFLVMADTIVMGLLVGQIMGRWGNFFNREAFGGFTDGLFAMQIPVSDASYTTTELLEKAVQIGGETYIQVHPTFLYEGLWNLGILLFLLWFRKRKRITGEMFYIYGVLYGLGRFFIEGLRTDQLLIFGKIPVSQIVAVACMVVFTTLLIQGRIKNKPEYIPPLSTTEE